jgi:type III restriction enzyme
LRLCVNQDGLRVMDRSTNRLTVIANETYEDFANQLQAEMQEEGIEFRKEMVKNEREKVKLRLRDGFGADRHFLDLWERIRERTRYRVRYDTSELVEQAAEAIKSKMPVIQRPIVSLSRADLTIDRRGVEGRQTGLRTETVETRFVIPDLVGQVQAGTGLSRSTVSEILLRSDRLGEALHNPQAFLDRTAALINSVKRELLVDGVEYLKTEGYVYEMNRFEDDDLKDYFESGVREVDHPDKTLYSHVVIDSGSSPERKFAEACDDNDDVLFYIKLPRWFVIESPVGQYNPDWAVAYRNDNVLYFVAETKGTGEDQDPPMPCCGRSRTSRSNAASAISGTSNRCSSRLWGSSRSLCRDGVRRFVRSTAAHLC